jgi:hypothetical protein
MDTWGDSRCMPTCGFTELLEKLSVLVPLPRANIVRYHGILAPHAKRREAVVPKKPDEEELRKTRGLSKNRILWAALLARTFNLKMETCPDCGGRLRIVAAVTDPLSVKTCLGETLRQGRKLLSGLREEMKPDDPALEL